MAGIEGILANVYLWIVLALVFLVILILMFIFLVILSKKTHAIIEFKAWFRGKPIAMFFRDDKQCDWKTVESEAGIIQDKQYGTFIMNKEAAYVDIKNRNLFLPFDASFSGGINMNAAHLVDSLKYILKDQNELRNFRNAVANNLIDENEIIKAVKTNVNVGSLKTMMNALIPHNISAKIEKIIAQRLQGYGKIDPKQAILVFVSIFGAILLGAMVIKLMSPTP